MIEKVGHIKNPLTVISVFAGIAEISGTIVLPFIEPQNQSTYIWFLMLFPTFLVGIFFATLNWNHRTLYAPSDYQNEENFVTSLGKSTAQERVVKLEEEVDEVVSDTATASLTEEPSPPTMTESVHSQKDTEASTTTPPPVTEPSIKYSIKENGASYQVPNERESVPSPNSFLPSVYERNRLTADIRLTEELAIKRITKLTGKKFRQGIKFESRKGKTVLFDAVSIDGNHFSAVEVKFFRNNVFSPSRITKVLLDCQHIVDDEDFLVKNFTLHLVIVSDAEGYEQRKLENMISRMIKSREYNVDLHVVTMRELESEF